MRVCVFNNIQSNWISGCLTRMQEDVQNMISNKVYSDVDVVFVLSVTKVMLLWVSQISPKEVNTSTRIPNQKASTRCRSFSHRAFVIPATIHTPHAPGNIDVRCSVCMCACVLACMRARSCV